MDRRVAVGAEMTREERIKEMAELTFDYVDSKNVSKLYLMGSNADEEMKPLLHNYGLAEYLYNAGYRKVPDGAVVLTKEEQEKHITMTKVNYKSIMRQLNQARKETAKEFAEKLKEKLQKFVYDNEDYDGKVDSGTLYGDVIGIIGNNGEIISRGLIDELLGEYEK